MSIKKIEYNTYTCDLCKHQTDFQKSQYYSGWLTITAMANENYENEDKYHVCLFCKKSYWEWLDQRRKLIDNGN